MFMLLLWPLLEITFMCLISKGQNYPQVTVCHLVNVPCHVQAFSKPSYPSPSFQYAVIKHWVKATRERIERWVQIDAVPLASLDSNLSCQYICGQEKFKICPVFSPHNLCQICSFSHHAHKEGFSLLQNKTKQKNACLSQLSDEIYKTMAG